ncbi:LOW QUALITY PROTEIN: hypothetical protein KIPB_010811 [Kipferlia bialata]|uniref:Uncharacterized protein n=1 Tax=Kipferlia bialata TaxID=797122 RepID=A0A9K3D6F3_9EUKA|nr:LOW QUALITY PROTEIN: hypothetical protein KIPB_010811 [Kipferlia bialata]
MSDTTALKKQVDASIARVAASTQHSILAFLGIEERRDSSLTVHCLLEAIERSTRQTVPTHPTYTSVSSGTVSVTTHAHASGSSSWSQSSFLDTGTETIGHSMSKKVRPVELVRTAGLCLYSRQQGERRERRRQIRELQHDRRHVEGVGYLTTEEQEEREATRHRNRLTILERDGATQTVVPPRDSVLPGDPSDVHASTDAVTDVAPAPAALTHPEATHIDVVPMAATALPPPLIDNAPGAEEAPAADASAPAAPMSAASVPVDLLVRDTDSGDVGAPAGQEGEAVSVATGDVEMQESEGPVMQHAPGADPHAAEDAVVAPVVCEAPSETVPPVSEADAFEALRAGAALVHPSPHVAPNSIPGQMSFPPLPVSDAQGTPVEAVVGVGVDVALEEKRLLAKRDKEREREVEKARVADVFRVRQALRERRRDRRDLRLIGALLEDVPALENLVVALIARNYRHLEDQAIRFIWRFCPDVEPLQYLHLTNLLKERLSTYQYGHKGGLPNALLSRIIPFACMALEEGKPTTHKVALSYLPEVQQFQFNQQYQYHRTPR